MKTKTITMVGILAAISVVISNIESYFPFIGSVIPGLKLGLANIVVVFVLYKYNFKTAICVSLVRVLIVALIRTGFVPFLFSLTGAIFSIVIMAILKKTKLSVIGVSVIGSVFHSIGQVLIGMVSLGNYNVIYYLPYLLLFSVPTGILVGIVAKRLLKYTEKIL